MSGSVCQFCAWKVNPLGQGLLGFFYYYYFLLFCTVFGGPALLGTKVEIIDNIRIGKSDSSDNIILKLRTNAWLGF